MYEGYEDNPMEHATGFYDCFTPNIPTNSNKKSATFDYHPDNSIDDEDEEEDDIVDVDDHDEDGHEGGDELEPHDIDDDIHLQAADSGNASATNSSAGGDQCCYDADASNDSNTNEMNLRTRIRHLNNNITRAATTKASSASTTPNVTATVSPELVRQKQEMCGFPEQIERESKHKRLSSSSSSEAEEDHATNAIIDHDSRSMPPPPPLVGAHIMGPKFMDLTRSTASSTPTTPAPFIPISEDTVFLDPEPPMPSIATSSPHSGDSWMNYSSNSSDDFSGLSEQIKAVTSGRQTGNNSSDEASSDFDSSIISQTEVMLKRYKSQQDAFESGSVTANSKTAATPPLTPKNLIHKQLQATANTTSTASPNSSTTSSLKSVKGAVKRLRCKDDDDDDDDDDNRSLHHHHHHHHPGRDKVDGYEAKDLTKKSSSSVAKKSTTTPKSVTPVRTTQLPATMAKKPMQEAQINKEAVKHNDKDIPMDTTTTPILHETVIATCTATTANVTNTTTTTPCTATPLSKVTTELQQQQLQQQEIKEISKSKKILQHGSKSLDIETKIQLCDDIHCLVDVRLIDFAHTAFVPRNNGSALFPTPPTTIHHGPDNGFLTGLDSLNRLLNEILNEEMC